jgi:hypothetical protein
MRIHQLSPLVWAARVHPCYHFTHLAHLLLIILCLTTGSLLAQSDYEKYSSSPIPFRPQSASTEKVTPVPFNQAAPQIMPGGNTTTQDDIRLFPSSNVQAEVHISIDPTNNNNMLASCNTYTNTFRMGYYYTTNGGRTWTGSDILPNGAAAVGDPSTAYDAAGNAYLATMIRSTPGGIVDGYGIQRSTNKGVTWTNQVRASGPDNAFDKEMIAADNTAGSPFANNLYCAWTNLATPRSVRFNRSTNWGATFSTPITLLNGFGMGANVQTGPNGEVYVCWANYGTGNLPANGMGFVRSTNGGLTFTAAGVAFAYSSIRVGGPDPIFNNTRVNDYPSMAVDKSCGARRGRIYIAYPTKENGNGKAIIQVRFSDNQGTTWSTPVTVSIATGRQNWFPWIAVDNITGEVSIVYYSLDTASGFTTNTYLAHSSNGGATFDNRRVSDGGHITAPINDSRFSPGYAGDYIGVVASGGRAYPVWADNRNGNWQIYGSPVSYFNITGTSTVCTGNTTPFQASNTTSANTNVT